MSNQNINIIKIVIQLTPNALKNERIVCDSR